MPAGTQPPAGSKPKIFLTYLWLYVRYERNNVKQIEYKQVRRGLGKACTYIKLPDRTLCISERDIHPLNDTWDEAICTSYFHPHSIAQQYCPEILISAHNGLDWRLNERDSWLHNGIKIFGDSGGAQLKMDSTDFVDPYRVINWYNQVVDMGVSLDVAPRPIDMKDDALIRSLAYAQRANNRVFLKERADHVKLLNCIHGFTLQQSRDWLHIVEEDGFCGWAAGADSNKMLGTSFRTYMTALLEGAPHMKDRFHFFGISGRHSIPAAAWLSRYATQVTTDSTNWIRGMRHRAYFHLLVTGELNHTKMGHNTRLVPLTPLPCNCEMCRRVGYWDVYHLPGRVKSQGLLVLHNLITFSRTVKMWANWADTLTLKEYTGIMNTYFCDDDDEGVRTVGRQPVVKEFRSRGQKVIEYIQCCVDEGMDEADRKFRPLLDHQPGRLPVKTLFGNPSGEPDCGPEKKEKATAALMGLRGSMRSILQNYIEFFDGKLEPELIQKMAEGAGNAVAQPETSDC
jgi:hypothetical protein